MTGYAATGNTGMIDRQGTGADKRCRRHTVTIVAHIRCRRMRNSLAHRNAATDMAIDAGARCHLGVIHAP